MPPKALSPQQAMFGALAEVCQMDGKLNAGRIGKTAKMLIDAGYTPDQVLAFPCWWSKVHYNGKQGLAPTPNDVSSRLKESLTYTNGNGAATANADPEGWDALGKAQEATVAANAHKYEDTDIPF